MSSVAPAKLSRPIPPAPPDRGVSAADDDAGVLALDPAYVLPRRIAWWAEREPERPFLEEVTGRTASYGQVVDGIRRWATLLRKLGVQPGERLLSMLPASIDSYLLWMAASCVGACEVPINPELRGEFLSHALTDAGARLCFARPEFVSLPNSVGVDTLDVVTVDRVVSPAADEEPVSIDWPAPEDPSCVIYTSGTTGPAKGVIITWAQMTATIGRIPRSWFSDADVVYCCHATFHVTGRSPLPAMSDVGGRIVLRERFSLSDFWDDIRAYGCTSTTPFISLLLGAPERADDRVNPLRVSFGSVDSHQCRRFSERFDVEPVPCYGSTEVGFPIVLRWPEELREDRGARRDCGRLRRGYEARIVDEAGRELPDGSAGELWIRPPARSLMTSGYLGLPEKTAETIVDGWYRTGDAVIRHPNGGFEFVDRLRDTIRRHGENISSSALESAVATDSEVQECAALGIPDPVAGQEILLVVVPATGRDIDSQALLARLTESLPRYMQPAYFAIQNAESVPRTPTSKIRKTALLDSIDLETARIKPSRAPDRGRSRNR